MFNLDLSVPLLEIKRNTGRVIGVGVEKGTFQVLEHFIHADGGCDVEALSEKLPSIDDAIEFINTIPRS